MAFTFFIDIWNKVNFLQFLLCFYTSSMTKHGNSLTVFSLCSNHMTLCANFYLSHFFLLISLFFYGWTHSFRNWENIFRWKILYNPSYSLEKLAYIKWNLNKFLRGNLLNMFSNFCGCATGINVWYYYHIYKSVTFFLFCPSGAICF